MSAPYEVRWGTFGMEVGRRTWIPCVWAQVVGEVLAICTSDTPGAEAYKWVPLHIIRGEIECRAAEQEAGSS